MAEFYGQAHRNFQDNFDSRRLADALENRVMRSSLAKMDKKFIQASDMFFLATVDHNGFPTVSHKGGDTGFVRVVDDRCLAFPCYDGNGMFYSVGNISENAKFGMLFIDFVTPRRLRIHGTAKVLQEDPLLADYPGSLLIVRVDIENIFTNCGRYIHKYRKISASEYVPTAGTEAPVPDWKRVDYLNDALPTSARDAAANAGEIISEADYRRDFWRGLD